MTPILQGKLVRLEPLTLAHLPALEEIAFEPSIWRYMRSIVSTPEQLRAYVETALQWEADGTAMPWATISLRDNKVAGSTRFYEYAPKDKTVRIGSTWLNPAYRRTGINVEAKLLQFTYGFETLGLNRIALETHHENVQSQNAMRALGATFEGVHRNAYVMADGSLRHNHWFSVIREDWPEVKAKLQARLAKHATL